MKSVCLVKYGDAVEGVEFREVDEPGAPGAGEVTVAVEFAPVNFNDLMVPWGVYPWKPEPPAVIGTEGSGIVVAVGAEVTGIKEGDRVVLPFMSQTWRQRLNARAEDLVSVPSAVSSEQASMLAINGATAWMLLKDFVKLERGDGIVFNAATSGVARWVIAIARHHGYKTIGLVRSAGDVETIKTIGCDHVFNVSDDLKNAKASVADVPVRLGLDVVGGEFSGFVASFVDFRGTLVNYGAATRKPIEIPAYNFTFKEIVLRGFFEGSDDNIKKVVLALRELLKLPNIGNVRQQYTQIYQPEDAKAAVAAAVAGNRGLFDFRTTR